MCSPIVYLYYCYCTFINLYVEFHSFMHVVSYVHMDRQKLFLEI